MQSSQGLLWTGAWESGASTARVQLGVVAVNWTHRIWCRACPDATGDSLLGGDLQLFI